MANWDDNDIEGIQEENLRYFYEEYSASVRKQLLAKNLLVPQNVYDVLYPRTKEALLAKNVPKITDLEESSKSIRDALIAKLVSENTSLEKLSEDTRNSLIAKNNLIRSAEDLLEKSYGYRISNISKNVPNESNIEKESDQARINNLVKNRKEASTNINIDSNAEEFLQNNISKNTSNESDLLNDSSEIRKNNISSNVSNTSDLEKDSKDFLKNNISANKANTSDLETDSAEFLQNNISANKSNPSDLQTDSEQFLKNNISANDANKSDLEVDSAGFLKNNISANVSKITDLEKDSEKFLKNNIASNKPNSSDLEADSAEFLKNNIASNKPNSSDLETDSAEFLKNNIVSNKPNNSDLESDSAEFLKNNIASNKPNNSDLEADSKEFLKNNISSNKVNNSDLETDSAEFLQNNIAANKSNNSDLEADSKSFLQNNIAANKPNNSDLESDSAEFFQNNIAANKPNNSDLEVDSAEFLQNNIAANKPNNSDLEDDSKPFFQNNIAANKPNSSDLLLDSEEFLQDNLAPNVPSSSDLLLDSQQFLGNNLSPNVPNNSDLLTDSSGFLNSNIASNVPSNSNLLNDSSGFLNNNLAPNVPDNGDLLTDSFGFLKDNLAANIPSETNLLANSIPIRNDLVSANVPNNTDLEEYSKPFRNNNLAHNPPTNQLGVVIEGLGTSAFLGISRVLTQGIILRQVLLAKNKRSKYSIDKFFSVASYDIISPTNQKDYLFSKNKYQYGTENEYGATSTNLAGANFGQNKLFGYGYGGVIVRDFINNTFIRAVNISESISRPLQEKYGTNNEIKLIETSIGGGFYSTDSISRKGGYFDDSGAFEKMSIITSTRPGSITDAIRNYNLSRNLYNINRITPGDLQSMDILQGNNDEGFQDLIAKTIGFFGGNQGIGAQLQGNLVPRGILIANEGAYIKGGSPETLLRPQVITKDDIGTAPSMMAKTVPGNPLMDTEFQAGRKGVMHIVRTIRDSYQGGDFDIAQNLFVQGEKDSIKGRKFVIGTKPTGEPKVARQRFNVANPYRPDNAKKLLFSLQNYSSGESFYFPPYIQDFSDSYGASWNSINFLGRPEPIFTYNNSTRDGTITFIVLTDYSQNIVIGTNYETNEMSRIRVNPTGHFTTKDVQQNNNKKVSQNSNPSRDAEQKKIDDAIKENESHKNLTPNTPETNVIQKDIDDLKKDFNALEKDKENSFIGMNKSNVYSESSDLVRNINDYMITKPSDEGFGSIDTKAEDSKKRIDEMIKNLSFQPSFFSGDKVDFVTKMEFLAKMTRPAQAQEGSGFSFTRPPVCHIHLGDWWNSDIVVDSVNFTYSDAPWTLDDGGRVQPMWATVTMNFKFIGTYRGQHGGPVLSSDDGGFYKARTNT